MLDSMTRIVMDAPEGQQSRYAGGGVRATHIRFRAQQPHQPWELSWQLCYYVMSPLDAP